MRRGEYTQKEWQDSGVTGEPLWSCFPQAGRPLQVLETTCSTREDTVLTQLLDDKEDCQLAVGPSARTGSAAGTGCDAIASVVYEASMVRKTLYAVCDKLQEESHPRPLEFWTQAMSSIIENSTSHSKNSNQCRTELWETQSIWLWDIKWSSSQSCPSQDPPSHRVPWPESAPSSDRGGVSRCTVQNREGVVGTRTSGDVASGEGAPGRKVSVLCMLRVAAMNLPLIYQHHSPFHHNCLITLPFI